MFRGAPFGLAVTAASQFYQAFEQKRVWRRRQIFLLFAVSSRRSSTSARLGTDVPQALVGVFACFPCRLALPLQAAHYCVLGPLQSVPELYRVQRHLARSVRD